MLRVDALNKVRRTRAVLEEGLRVMSQMEAAIDPNGPPNEHVNEAELFQGIPRLFETLEMVEGNQ